jgi:hypothetical protein
MTISRDPDGRAELEATDSATAQFMKPTRDIMPEEMFHTGVDVVVAGLRVRYDLP